MGRAQRSGRTRTMARFVGRARRPAGWSGPGRRRRRHGPRRARHRGRRSSGDRVALVERRRRVVVRRTAHRRARRTRPAAHRGDARARAARRRAVRRSPGARDAGRPRRLGCGDTSASPPSHERHVRADRGRVDAGTVLAALADPTRRDVLTAVAARAGTATATELAAELPVTRQAITKHLTVLAEAGLVTSVRTDEAVRWSPAHSAWIADERLRVPCLADRDVDRRAPRSKLGRRRLRIPMRACAAAHRLPRIG